MNALIARTGLDALLLGYTMNLPIKEWQFYGYGNALAGSQFDKIVVIPPWDRPFTDQKPLWLEERVPLTLKPDGKLVRMGWGET